MRSFIIVEVEHGETTDEVEAILNNVSTDWMYSYPGVDVLNSAVAIDLPQYITAENVHSFLRPQ